MRILALEAFDETGQLRSDGAGLSTVLARLGSQCFETAVAIAQRPIEQCINGNRRSFRMRDVVGAGSDLLGAARSQRSEEHTSELQSQSNLVCRLLLAKQESHTRALARLTVGPRPCLVAAGAPSGRAPPLRTPRGPGLITAARRPSPRAAESRVVAHSR